MPWSLRVDPRRRLGRGSGETEFPTAWNVDFETPVFSVGCGVGPDSYERSLTVFRTSSSAITELTAKNNPRSVTTKSIATSRGLFLRALIIGGSIWRFIGAVDARLRSWRMKLLSVIEASWVTGPAKILLDFALLARQLPPEERVETSVITFEREGSTARNFFLETLQQYGIPAVTIRQRSVTDRRTVPALQDAFRRFQPDILETNAVKSHFWMRLAGLGKLRPWVAVHHGYTTTDLKMRLYNQMDRWSLRAPARIIAVSQAFQQQLCDRGVPRERITVLHCAVSPDWMQRSSDKASLRRELGVGQDERVVLTVGRLSHEKAHADLVAALSHLREEAPVRLIIVGEGPERKRIEEAARGLGVDRRVTLTGFLSDPRPYYAIADVFAMSSLTEGSPMALLEAMAARVPVVATAVGGIRRSSRTGKARYWCPRTIRRL